MSAIAADEAASQEGLVCAAAYENGRRVRDVLLSEAGEWAKRPHHVVWLGLNEPSKELLGQVQKQFALHPLAVEDAEKAHQYPKLEQYNDCIFIAVRTAQIDEGGDVSFGETQIFAGAGYVVTVRHGTSLSFASVRARSEARPRDLSEGEDFIVYALLDFIVDNYFPVIDEMNRKTDAIEDDLFAVAVDGDRIRALYNLRRSLLRLRNAVAPLVEVCRSLERTTALPIDPEMRPHFRDVTDHVRRILERIDTLREVLAFAFEASLMHGQMQQNDIVRRLTAWAAILAAPTLIAGVYGMNFKNMPELDWRYGYFAALASMALICIVLYRRFRNLGWL